MSIHAPRRPNGGPTVGSPLDGTASPSASDPRPAPGLRVHLLALVLVVLLPALGVGAAAAWQAVRASQAAFEARLRDTARALSLALENELDVHVTAARALAASPLLDAEDLSAFRAWAAEVAAGLGSWGW